MNKALSNRLKKLDNKIPLTYGDLDDVLYRKVAEKIVSKQILDEGAKEKLIEIINLLENDLKYGTHTYGVKMEFYIGKLQIQSKKADKRLVKQARDELIASSKISAEECEEQISKLEQKLGICRLPK